MNLQEDYITENYSESGKIMDLSLNQLMTNYAIEMANVTNEVVDRLYTDEGEFSLWWVRWYEKILEILKIFMNPKYIAYVGFTFILISVFLYYALMIE